MEQNGIDWELFESLYWSPESGKSYQLVLANWRQEVRSYDDDKTEKPVIVFDVLKIDDVEVPIGRKSFVTGAASFAHDVRPIIEAAERRGEKAIHVYLEYGKDKKYRVLDLQKIRGGVPGEQH